jgi:hypothetical protein
LGEGDVSTLWTPDGREITVTSLERTVLDCARILPLEQAAVFGDHALRKGADPDELQRRLERRPGNWRSRRARLLLDALDGRSGGWSVFRLEWKHLDRPAELKRRLQAMAERPRGMSA